MPTHKKGPIISAANLDHRNKELKKPPMEQGNRSTGFGRKRNPYGRSALEDPDVKLDSQFGFNTPSYYATPKFDVGYRTDEQRQAEEEENQSRQTQEKMFNMFAKLKPLPLKSPRTLDTQQNMQFELVATKAPETEFGFFQGGGGAKGRLRALECVDVANNGSNSARHLGPPKLPALANPRVQSTSAAQSRMEKMVARVPKPPRLNPAENTGGIHGNAFTQPTFTKVLHAQPLAPIKTRKNLVSMDAGKPVVVVREMGRNITNQTDISTPEPTGEYRDKSQRQSSAAPEAIAVHEVDGAHNEA